MNVLVVYTHPSTMSFTAAVLQRVLAGLAAGGHKADVIDLYSCGFEPALPAEDRFRSGDDEACDPVVRDHIARLRIAEAIVFVYPTWWSGPPAMLKGWIDRVWVADVAYTMDSKAHLRPKLGHIRRLIVVTSHGSAKHVNMIEGESGKLLFGRALRRLVRWNGRSRWISLYNIDRSTPAQRQTHLTRVEAAMANL